MWQPFNGLQVFPTGTGQSHVDESLFTEIPPNMCKKGGAKIRIKCTDDGMPVDKKEEQLVSLEQEYLKATEADITRAATKKPRPAYKGDSFGHMSEVLNGWLQQGQAPTKPCEQWNVTELYQLQAMLYLARDAQLDEVYQSTKDGRRMRHTMQDMADTWAHLKTLAEGSNEHAQRMHRDGHCHEAVMWYVHHLAEDAKQLLSESGVTIPLLSPERHTCPHDASDAHTELCKVYDQQVTCASCHSNSGPPSAANNIVEQFVASK